MHLPPASHVAGLSLLLAAGIPLGCGSFDESSNAYESADLHEGGRLYDRIWADSPPDNFTDDHPLWASRPDTSSSDIAGSETWRCKECHGWDYLGVDGQYGTGSHRTGFPGILDSGRSPDEIFELLMEEPSENPIGHAYGRFLTERQVWDLARFCLEGAIATDDIVDEAGIFIGTADSGGMLFADGVGPEPSCASCHGGNGRVMPHVDDGHEDDAGEAGEPPGAPEPEHTETVGSVARENPWEFHHKSRFGHPGSPMHGYQKGGASHEDLGALGAFAQSLP